MNKEQLEESCKVVNVETCGPEQLIKNKKVQKLVEALEYISKNHKGRSGISVPKNAIVLRDTAF